MKSKLNLSLLVVLCLLNLAHAEIQPVKVHTSDKMVHLEYTVTLHRETKIYYRKLNVIKKSEVLSVEVDAEYSSESGNKPSGYILRIVTTELNPGGGNKVYWIGNIETFEEASSLALSVSKSL